MYEKVTFKETDSVRGSHGNWGILKRTHYGRLSWVSHSSFPFLVDYEEVERYFEVRKRALTHFRMWHQHPKRKFGSG